MPLWSNTDATTGAPKFDVAPGHKKYSIAFTGTVTTGNNYITSPSSTTGIQQRMVIEPSGGTLPIPQHWRITAANSTVLVMNKNYTGPNTSGVSFTVYGELYGNVAYQNTTPDAFTAGLVEGVYAVSTTEIYLRENLNNYVNTFSYVANATTINFSNGDIVTTSNSNTYSVNATGSITTNSTGGIVDIRVTNKGLFAATWTLATAVTNSTGGATTGNTASANIQPGIHNSGAVGINAGVSPGWNVLKYGEGGLTSVTGNALYGTSFANNETLRFSNGSINAVANVVTNSVGAPVGFTISTPGLFTNTGVLVFAFDREKHLYSINVTSNATAIGFSNGDLIQAGNGIINAVANITSNATGGITSTTVFNPGLWSNVSTNAMVTFSVTNSTGGATTGNVASTGFGANLTISANTGAVQVFNFVVTETANGIGFTNGNIITGGNGSISATANVTTNATGGITSTTILNHGVFWAGTTNAMVTVSVANSTGGTTGVGNTAAVTIAANVVANVGTNSVFVAATLGGHAGRVRTENLVYMRNINSATNTAPFYSS